MTITADRADSSLHQLPPKARDRPQIFPLSIAPMMDRTDRHYRYFMRQITRQTLLYTEMITVPAILHGDRPHLLDFSPLEKPLVLQLGGDDPAGLADCARIAEDWDYDEINLNVGCPSSRVQSGRFGACLMAEPERVARAVAAMAQATRLPISVKHRIGIDDLDRYEDMARFVKIVADAGCRYFTVHARKAWLQGLDPKQNRTVPPLRYGDVYRLKQDFPTLQIEINGGFVSLEQAKAQLPQVDAVMIGRAAYDDPYLFATADAEFYGDEPASSEPAPSEPAPDRRAIAEAMVPYLDHWRDRDFKAHRITRHMLQLFAGQPGSRLWKRQLTERGCRLHTGGEVITETLAQMP